MTEERRKYRLIGVVVSLLICGLTVIILLSIILPVVFPPPEPQGIAIEFEPEEQPPLPVTLAGGEVRAKVNDPGEQLEVAPPDAKPAPRTHATRPNNPPDAKPATPDEHGDVERYVPPQPKVNPNALFQSNNSGAADADNKTNIKDNSFFAGTGTSDEVTRGPNATSGSFAQEKGVGFSLAGRSASGRLPLPEYKVQKSGKVLVDITVDQQGKVVRAAANLKGSTVTDAQLIKAAEEAARKAVFNANPNAAALQTGTISYIFKLE